MEFSTTQKCGNKIIGRKPQKLCLPEKRCNNFKHRNKRKVDELIRDLSSIRFLDPREEDRSFFFLREEDIFERGSNRWVSFKRLERNGWCAPRIGERSVRNIWEIGWNDIEIIGRVTDCK